MAAASGPAQTEKGYELIFSFDPARIQFLGADAGDVLTRSGNPFSFFVVPDVAPADSAWVDGAMLAGSSFGPGILAFFDFKALTLGDTPVQCQLVDVRDSNSARILPDCVSGLVHVVGSTPVPRPSWGAVKTLYR
jgi:hypothetical protein